MYFLALTTIPIWEQDVVEWRFTPGREKGAGEEGGFSPPAGNVPPGNAGERFRVSCVAEKELRWVRHQAAGALWNAIFSFCGPHVEERSVHGNPALHGGKRTGGRICQGYSSGAGRAVPQYFPGLESAVAAREAFSQTGNWCFFHPGTGVMEGKSIRIHAQFIFTVVVQGDAVKIYDHQQIQAKDRRNVTLENLKYNNC